MKRLKSIMKEKGFLVLMLAAVLAVTGIAAYSITNEKTENQNNLYVDFEEEGTTFPMVQETTAFDETQVQVADAETTFPGDAAFVQSETTLDTSNLMDATDEPTQIVLDAGETTLAETEAADLSELGETRVVDAEENIDADTSEEVEVAGSALNLAFSDASTMRWPVEGNVIMDFSMDGTVYFATLEQYKYNPAILIQSEVNTPVLAAANAVVTEIGSNEEIGEYVIMELGNEYQVLYGQLKAISVSVGETVEMGHVIGFVSEPTKYYVVEGSNLYLQMTKGEDPIDPLDYIR